MGLINKTRTDPKKELDGEWFQYTEDEYKTTPPEAGSKEPPEKTLVSKGIRLLIARMNNARFREELELLLAPHIEAQRTNTLAKDVLEVATNRAMAVGILVGWENLEELQDGKPVEVPYSSDAAYRFLRDPGYKDLRDFVSWKSGRAANYLEALAEGGEGN